MLRRAAGLRERMDDERCDPALLRNTYAQFSVVNQLVSGWERAFRRYLQPVLGPGATVLDVGCGGGDLCRRLALWGRACGGLRITGADPDPRAVGYARSRARPPGVSFVQSSAEELAAAGERFDVVVSNHLLHHLGEEEIPAFLETTARLSRRRALHNDLTRHPVAYGTFALARPFFRSSFIVEDGLRSIRRAYTAAELERLAPPGWRVARMAPFRNLLLLGP